MSEDDVTELVALARSLVAPVVAIELQWEVDEDDDGTRWVLLLCAIVAAPGASHSRFRAHALRMVPAEAPDERARAGALATAVATALGVEVRMPALDRCGGTGGSRWIEAQGVGSPAPYVVRWDAYTWSDAGERIDESGELELAATSGEAARAQVEDRVRDRLGAAVRPVFVRTAIDGTSTGAWSSRTPPRSGDVPGTDELRAWHLDGRSIAAIVDAVRARRPAPTPLAIMRALEIAFDVTLDALAPVAARCAERVSSAQLDDAVEPIVVAQRPRWDRPRRLREVHAAGASLAAFLRAERVAGAGTIELMKSLRDAFEISLGDAKIAVGTLGHDRDDDVDAELAAAIAARRH